MQRAIMAQLAKLPIEVAPPATIPVTVLAERVCTPVTVLSQVSKPVMVDIARYHVPTPNPSTNTTGRPNPTILFLRDSGG